MIWAHFLDNTECWIVKSIALAQVILVEVVRNVGFISQLDIMNEELLCQFDLS